MHASSPLKYALAIAAAWFALVAAGCGSSSPGRPASYTFTPVSKLGHGVYITFSGPTTDTWDVVQAFQAALPGDYVETSSKPTGISDCTMAAGSGKVVQISVVGLNQLAPTLCDSIRGRF
jgi:hypothetical protein